MLRLLFVILVFVVVGTHPASAMVFDHAEHYQFVEILPCSTCHVEGAYSIVPDRTICKDCHEDEFVQQVDYPALRTHTPLWAFNHRTEAKGHSIDWAEGRSIDCSACHQQDYCLECHKAGFPDQQDAFSNDLANVHRSDFQVSHPIAARTDPQLCNRCHEAKFCSKCHDSFNRNDLGFDSHRRGWSNGTLNGQHAFYDESQCQGCHIDSVLPTHTWSWKHAREARKNLATCQTCHPEGDICLKCHSAKTGLGINPHPKDWGDISSRLDKASGGRSCRKCHNK